MLSEMVICSVPSSYRTSTKNFLSLEPKSSSSSTFCIAPTFLFSPGCPTSIIAELDIVFMIALNLDSDVLPVCSAGSIPLLYVFLKRDGLACVSGFFASCFSLASMFCSTVLFFGPFIVAPASVSKVSLISACALFFSISDLRISSSAFLS